MGRKRISKNERDVGKDIGLLMIIYSDGTIPALMQPVCLQV